MDSESFIALDKGQGLDRLLTPLWTRRARTFVSSSVFTDELVIIADFGGNIVALERSSGKRVWAAKAEAGITEKLFVYDDLVWAFDVDGNIGGYELAQGRCQTRYKLAYGGWGVRQHGDCIFFVNRVSRLRYGPNGVASKMSLQSGEISVFAEGVVSDENGYKDNTRIAKDEEAVFFFIAPDIVKFSIADGRVLQEWHIPGCISLSGLVAFDGCCVAVTEVDTGWKTSIGGKRYLEYNPTPVVFAAGDQVKGFPVVARGVLKYTNQAIDLGDGRFLIEAADWLFLCERGQVCSLHPLPGRTFWGNYSAGLFKVCNRLVLFQADYADGKYLMNVYEVDPSTFEVASLGPPMMTHPRGRNFLKAAVDQSGPYFLLRGDGRYHLLTWQEG
jgi:hypothetical protein